MQSTAVVAANEGFGSAAGYEGLADEQLLEAMRSGHDDALTTLFDRYHRLVYSIAGKIVRDPAEAEDVMQNVFLETYRSMAKFDRAKGTYKVWLLQYAYHRAINRKQQLTARQFYRLTSMEDAERYLCRKQSSFRQFTQVELKLLMHEGLSSLNAMQRQVIELATYKGLSMQEIALYTSESLVNVRHHYYRGLKKLRSFLTDNKSISKAFTKTQPQANAISS